MLKWVLKIPQGGRCPQDESLVWRGMAWASAETKNVDMWGVAGKNMKCTINTLMQQICAKANIMLVTEDNKSKEICS